LVSNKPDTNYLETRLKNLQKMAPDIVDVILATVTNPASGFTTVAQKIAEKIKMDDEKT
jgi:hypothetical protein